MFTEILVVPCVYSATERVTAVQGLQQPTSTPQSKAYTDVN